MTSSPRRRASFAASSTSRLFPTPASPPINTIEPADSVALSASSFRRVSCVDRPTKGVASFGDRIPLTFSNQGISNRRQRTLMPFSSNSPRSSSSARAVPNTPYTVSEAKMPPGGAFSSMRFVTITVSPCRSPFSTMISPVCRPMRS